MRPVHPGLEKLAKQRAEEAQARISHLEKMPRLSRATIEEYMNWTARNAPLMEAPHLAACLTLAELTVRLHMGDAQGKDTQHTLVRDGVIDPPPNAS